jgi:thioredoxin-like negative regulator of GroEL
MSNCKKQSSKKNIDVARAITRANRFRKFTRICKQNPNDHCARNTLAQLQHDSGGT